MYRDFYHMKMEAFSNQPLPEIFFASSSHKEGWYYLIYGINSHEPFLLVTGDYGIGKTTLCLKLVQSLKKSEKVPFVYIPTPNYEYSKILSRVVTALGIDPDKLSGTNSLSENNLQNIIFEHFENEGAGKEITIILDDVQEMELSTLTKLRLFANFNSGGVFPIKLILFAHSSFADKLQSEILQPLHQRIKRRCHLYPFNLAEMKEYIYFRLFKSGAAGIPTFDDEAIQMIFEHTQGIPRLINNLCDSCLLIGAMQGASVIDKEVVTKALGSFAGSPTKPTTVASPEPSTPEPVLEKPQTFVDAPQQSPFEDWQILGPKERVPNLETEMIRDDEERSEAMRRLELLNLVPEAKQGKRYSGLKFLVSAGLVLLLLVAVLVLSDLRVLVASLFHR